MFWRKKTNSPNENALYSREYEKLYNRIVELDSQIRILETKFKVLETNYDNLRGNFNRKLSSLKKEEESEQSKDINTSGDVYLG